MPRNIPISKFADFILFYKINGKVKQKMFEDTEADIATLGHSRKESLGKLDNYPHSNRCDYEY